MHLQIYVCKYELVLLIFETNIFFRINLINIVKIIILFQRLVAFTLYFWIYLEERLNIVPNSWRVIN